MQKLNRANIGENDNSGHNSRLPHPSWNWERYGVAERKRVSADDFWRRLGA